MKDDQPNEPAASPTNHVVPVRTPEHGIKPMEGAVTSVPATDANVLDEVLEKLGNLEAYWRNEMSKKLVYHGVREVIEGRLRMLQEVTNLVTRIQNLHRIQP